MADEIVQVWSGGKSFYVKRKVYDRRVKLSKVAAEKQRLGVPLTAIERRYLPGLQSCATVKEAPDPTEQEIAEQCKKLRAARMEEYERLLRKRELLGNWINPARDEQYYHAKRTEGIRRVSFVFSGKLASLTAEEDNEERLERLLELPFRFNHYPGYIQ